MLLLRQLLLRLELCTHLGRLLLLRLLLGCEVLRSHPSSLALLLPILRILVSLLLRRRGSCTRLLLL